MSATRDLIIDGIVDPTNTGSIIKPFVLSHGALECFNLKESRRFYEEFLGLECVRHAIPAMLMRCGLKFHIVCVEVGDQIKPVSLLNHWGIDVLTQAEVDEAHQNAIRYQEKYKIRQIMEPAHQHGIYSFYLEDMDYNWWEISYCEGFVHDDVYDFGDRFSMDDNSPIGMLEN